MAIFCLLGTGCEPDSLSDAYKNEHFKGSWNLKMHRLDYKRQGAADSSVLRTTSGVLSLDVDAVYDQDPLAIGKPLCDSVGFLVQLRDGGAFQTITNGLEYRGFWSYTSDLESFTIFGNANGTAQFVTLGLDLQPNALVLVHSTFGGNPTSLLVQETLEFTR
jgi:hypothetical protein